jgi:hypothetical protein
MSKEKHGTSKPLRLGRDATKLRPLFLFSGTSPAPGPQAPPAALTAAGTVTPEGGQTLISISAELVVAQAGGAPVQCLQGSPATLAATAPGTGPTSYSFTFPGFVPQAGQVLSVIITVNGVGITQTNVTPLSFESPPQIVSNTLSAVQTSDEFTIVYSDSMGPTAFQNTSYHLLQGTTDVTKQLTVTVDDPATNTTADFILDPSLPNGKYTLQFTAAVLNIDGVPITPPAAIAFVLNV